jgi:hypothetical protein
MTTIAYKGGVVACDSQSTHEQLVCDGRDKAIKANGKVYLISGSLVLGHQFVKWVSGDRAGECPITPDSTIEVLEMDLKTGRARTWEGSMPLLVMDKMYVMGSGCHLALGAMAAGSDPVAAVKIACQYDTGSSGRVQVFRSEKATSK